MKKIFVISASFLFLLLVLTGCSKSPQISNQIQNKNGQPDNSGKPGKMRLPDFGQPERTADIRGIVKSTVGNSVTVLKLDMPAGNRTTDSGSEATSSSSTDKTVPAVSLGGSTIPGGNQAARGASAGGRFMTGGPGGPGGPGEQTEESRAQMLAKLKELSTGEETVIIPVGIQMLKSSLDTETKKRTMVEATLSDITSDKTITIWLNTAVTDKKVAEFVLIN